MHLEKYKKYAKTESIVQVELHKYVEGYQQAQLALPGMSDSCPRQLS